MSVHICMTCITSCQACTCYHSFVTLVLEKISVHICITCITSCQACTCYHSFVTLVLEKISVHICMTCITSCQACTCYHSFVTLVLEEMSVHFVNDATRLYNLYNIFSSSRIWHPVTSQSKMTEWLWRLHILFSLNVPSLGWMGNWFFFFFPL